MRIRTSMILSIVAVAVAGTVALTGCKKKTNDTIAPSEAAEQAVYTTFYPTTYLAERIAGDAVPVVCPLPEGEDPIFWQPDRETIARYQDAALIVINGASFEKWVDTVSLPDNRVVDTAASFADSFIKYATSTTHTHGPGGEHTHEGIDGHTWVDPVLAKAQAEAILDAMVGAFPDHKDTFEANYRALATDLDALDASWRELTASVENATLLASHPAYNYLAARYGWDITNFDLDPDADSIDEETFQEIIAATGPRTVLMWEGEPSDTLVVMLRNGTQVQSVYVSPCETPDEAAGDYLQRMNDNIARLRAALSEEG